MKNQHSIGTFVARDRTHSVASSSKSFKEDFPQRENVNPEADIDEHSLRHASYPRKRCTRCARGEARDGKTLNLAKARLEDIREHGQD
ncbi:unnamed protein product [Phaedon cochleariae]|uniref:Uncharacterized protein n=1 Tax=Phaedon cochleariae TaxID=80249 RepID=A0A9N9SFY0_PHACE|nr:unnamed protein product [Phaedon cochleariae]